METFQFRLIDTAGGEIGIINDSRRMIQIGERVKLPDGSNAAVVEIYDDENGREGNVQATLVVEREGVRSSPRQISITPSPIFGVFTVDGQGWGDARFFGENVPGGLVSFWGTGLDQDRELYLLIDDQWVVKADYLGPAGLPLPGITQINFRIPEGIRRHADVPITFSRRYLPANVGWSKVRVSLRVE